MKWFYLLLGVYLSQSIFSPRQSIYPEYRVLSVQDRRIPTKKSIRICQDFYYT